MLGQRARAAAVGSAERQLPRPVILPLGLIDEGHLTERRRHVDRLSPHPPAVGRAGVALDSLKVEGKRGVEIGELEVQLRHHVTAHCAVPRTQQLHPHVHGPHTPAQRHPQAPLLLEHLADPAVLRGKLEAVLDLLGARAHEQQQGSVVPADGLEVRRAL